MRALAIGVWAVALVLNVVLLATAWSPKRRQSPRSVRGQVLARFSLLAGLAIGIFRIEIVNDLVSFAVSVALIVLYLVVMVRGLMPEQQARR